MAHRIFPSGTLPLPLPPERNPLPLDEQADPEPGLGHRVAFYGQRLVDAEHREAFAKFYNAQSGDARIILLEGCSKNLDNLEWFEAWARAESRNPVALLFAGSTYAHKAWEARGGKLAKDVGQGQWALFSAWLKSASDYLYEAAILTPKDPEPFHRLMRVAIGDASLCKWSLNELFEIATAYRPDHLPSHMEMLTRKTAKWGGSHEQMFAFADSVTAKAPSGSLLHTLTPMAIIERMVHYMIDGAADEANAYLRSDSVRAKLADCYAKTVGSGKMTDSPLNPWLYNWLAAALIYSNSHEGRKVLLELIGDQITERPWAYIQMPVIGLVNELRESYGLPVL